jgi:hypothetical protein
MVKDGDTIGIARGESGRSCESHEVCGEHVAVGDWVTFKLVVIEVDGDEEEAINAINILYGTESCRVGFLPCQFVHGRRNKEVVNKFGQVLDFYKDSNHTRPSIGRTEGFSASPHFIF